MARKKKIEDQLQYIHVGLSDTLVRIAIKYNKKIDDLRALNPDIRCNSEHLEVGRKVRIS